MADVGASESHPEPISLHEQSDSTPNIELNPIQEHDAGIPQEDVVMADAPVHHDETPVDTPAPGDGVFDMKTESADAALGFDDYDEDDADADADQYAGDDVMQIDLDNADVEELERQKQILLEQKKKLIEQLKASGYSADMPEFAALEAEVQEAEAEAAAAAAAASATPGKKRGRPRKYTRADGTLSMSGDFDGKKRRGRPPKKRTKLDEAGSYEPDAGYYQPEHPVAPESSQSTQTFTAPKIKYTTETNEAKRSRAQWSLAETKSLLRLMELGYHDADNIWEQLSQQGGNRKNLELVRAKRIQLAQKAAARGISIIELLREEILKMEASGIPAESGLMDDEPVVLDPTVSVADVPVDPPGAGGSKSRRPGRPKRPSDVAPTSPAPSSVPTKVTMRPSIRFTPEPSADVRTLVSELRQAQDMNRQILFHHTQMMEVLFRELQRVKTANKMLLQHAQLSVDFLSEEELPVNPLAGSSFAQPAVLAPPNSLANSVALEASTADDLQPSADAAADSSAMEIDHDTGHGDQDSTSGNPVPDAAGEDVEPPAPSPSPTLHSTDAPAASPSKLDVAHDTDDEEETHNP